MRLQGILKRPWRNNNQQQTEDKMYVKFVLTNNGAAMGHF